MQHVADTQPAEIDANGKATRPTESRRGILSLIAARGWLLLPVAAVILLATVMYKGRLEQARRAAFQNAESESGDILASVRPAPQFEAYNSQMKIFRLESYLGRHPVLLIFYDGKLGADQDPLLAAARVHMPAIERTGAKVVAVSTALPQHNRAILSRTAEPFPFDLLSDPGFIAHQLYGRQDPETGEARPAIFYIDRGGRVAWSGRQPVPWQRLPDELADIWAGVNVPATASPE